MRSRTSTAVAASLLAGGEHRVLSPSAWALFEALYAGRGEPVSDDFLRKAIGASSLSKHLHQLRRALAGSRYRLETDRGAGHELRSTETEPLR